MNCSNLSTNWDSRHVRADGLVALKQISFGATKPTARPEDGDGVPETSENLHIMTQLSAWEYFIEFCRRESFKTYITTAYDSKKNSDSCH
jgi:hypothetical protein